MQTEVDATADAFVLAWEKPDADKILPFLNVPLVFINSEFGVAPITDALTLRNIVDNMVAERIAESYARTDILGRETKVLSERVAMFSCTEVAYDSSGTELRRFGSTWTFVKSGDDWKIGAFTS